MEELNFGPSKALLVPWLGGTWLGSLIAGAAMVGVASDEGASVRAAFGVGCLVLATIGTVYVLLYFQSIRYHVDDSHVTKSHGVLWKVRRSVPLEKVTHVDARRGPIERLLGFGQVWVFTPSTGETAPEGRLVGIAKPHELRDTLLARAEAAKAGAVAPPAAAVAASDDSVGLLREILKTLQRIEQRLGADQHEA